MISGHPRLGIENTGGGNGELEPPGNHSFNGLEVSGTVNGAVVPDGSIVQVFFDPDDEGRQFLAQATVDGAAFSAPVGMMNFTEVCTTVTHATSGNTSEFSCFTPVFTPLLDIRRVAEPPENINVQAGRDSVIAAIALTTGGNAAEVESMSLQASGSADESTDVTGLGLYHDANEDGVLSNTAPLIGGPVPVDSDDGTAVFSDLNASIPGDTVQHWLLVVSLDAAAAQGQSIEISLQNNSDVDSQSLLPPAPILETGSFPVASDIGTIIMALPTPEEIQAAITSGVGATPEMDINGDGAIDAADVVAAENL